MSVAAAQDWDSVFLLDRYCVIELEFWKNNLRSVNTRSVSDSVTPFVSIYSDASDVACAGHIDGKDIVLIGCLLRLNLRRVPLTVNY